MQERIGSLFVKNLEKYILASTEVLNSKISCKFKMMKFKLSTLNLLSDRTTLRKVKQKAIERKM
jgi:ferredoxin-fold anticodon binding domain-containing protein